MTYFKSQPGTNLMSLEAVQQNILSRLMQFNEYTVIVVNEGEGTFYYQGRIINRIFYKQHLNLFDDYPASEDIMRIGRK